jgi:hypothetical protein
MRSFLKSYLRNTQAIAFLEFAFVAPILVILLLGSIEVANYVYFTQKAQAAVTNMLSLINSGDNIEDGTISAYHNRGVAKIFLPILMVGGGDYKTIWTSIKRDNTAPDPYVWFNEHRGNLNNSTRPPADSRGIFTDYYYGKPETLEDKEQNKIDSWQTVGIGMVDGDQLLFAEIYAVYKPLIRSAVTTELLGMDGDVYYYRTPPMRPRSGGFELHPDDLR